MSATKQLLSLACAAGLACMAGPAAMAAGDDSATWALVAYAWIPNIKADLVSPGGDVVSSDNLLPGIVDNLEGGFLGRVEVQGDFFGFFADAMWLKLGHGKDFARASTDSDLSAWFADAAAVWSPGSTRYDGVEFYGGLRLLDVDLETTIDPLDPDVPKVDVGLSSSYYDLLVGARYIARLSDSSWSLTGKLDGSWGDTDGTWSVAATANYQRAPDSGEWIFGYRYFQIDLGDGEESLDLSLHGPLIGYAFIF